MCSKDIRVVKLLAYNNIPFVLHSNQTDEEEEETYIFVSKKVKENIIIPIVNKKKLFTLLKYHVLKIGLVI
jgi:hypothetical protein